GENELLARAPARRHRSRRSGAASLTLPHGGGTGGGGARGARRRGWDSSRGRRPGRGALGSSRSPGSDRHGVPGGRALPAATGRDARRRGRAAHGTGRAAGPRAAARSLGTLRHQEQSSATSSGVMEPSSVSTSDGSGLAGGLGEPLGLALELGLGLGFFSLIGSSRAIFAQISSTPSAQITRFGSLGYATFFGVRKVMSLPLMSRSEYAR